MNAKCTGVCVCFRRGQQSVPPGEKHASWDMAGAQFGNLQILRASGITTQPAF